MLGADTIDRQDYFLNESENKVLFEKDKLAFEKLSIYNTDLRIEKWNLINKLQVSGDDILIVFTHEWAINEKVGFNQLKIDILLNSLKNVNNFIL